LVDDLAGAVSLMVHDDMPPGLLRFPSLANAMGLASNWLAEAKLSAEFAWRSPEFAPSRGKDPTLGNM
jgi:hypothetical protein